MKEGLLAEDVSACRSAEVVLPHIFGSFYRTLVFEASVLLFFVGQEEGDDVGGVVSHQVEAMVVNTAVEFVVAIDELYELSSAGFDAEIP